MHRKWRCAMHRSVGVVAEETASEANAQTKLASKALMYIYATLRALIAVFEVCRCGIEELVQSLNWHIMQLMI